MGTSINIKLLYFIWCSICYAAPIKDKSILYQFSNTNFSIIFPLSLSSISEVYFLCVISIFHKLVVLENDR